MRPSTQKKPSAIQPSKGVPERSTSSSCAWNWPSSPSTWGMSSIDCMCSFSVVFVRCGASQTARRLRPPPRGAPRSALLQVDDAVVVGLAIAVIGGLRVLQDGLAERVLVHDDHVIALLLELADQP